MTPEPTENIRAFPAFLQERRGALMIDLSCPMNGNVPTAQRAWCRLAALVPTGAAGGSAVTHCGTAEVR